MVTFRFPTAQQMLTRTAILCRHVKSGFHWDIKITDDRSVCGMALLETSRSLIIPVISFVRQSGHIRQTQHREHKNLVSCLVGRFKLTFGM